MAVTATDILLDTNEPAVQLVINNGDLEKINQVIKDWNFRDYQSFIRFAVSIMLDTEDKFLAIKKNTTLTPVRPSDALVNSTKEA